MEALDPKGQILGVSGEREFHRAAMYNGSYHEQLMSLHLPIGTPLEFMPPTYTDEHHSGNFMNRQNVMMNFPGVMAEAYLDFYEATKEKKYLEAAKNIADTYRKLQLPEGTWP